MNGSESKPLETPKRIKPLVDRAYREVQEAHEHGKKVAWCLGPVCFVPLRAMDRYLSFIHLENYGARLAARRVAHFLHRIAEDSGLNKDACSYLRGAYGMHRCWALGVPTPPELEPSRLPEPDILITINYCHAAVNLTEMLYRDLKVPTFIIDGQFAVTDGDLEARVPYAKRNLEEYFAFLEEQLGHRMDYDKLLEVMAGLKEMGIVRKEALDMSKTIPSPFTVFDEWISMGAGNYLAGTPESIEYFKDLKAEIAQRVANKVAAVPNERIRLLWNDVAVWSRIGHLARLFSSHNAAVVWNYYSRNIACGHPESLDLSNPIESLARDQMDRNPWIHVSEKARILTKAVEEFSIDGIISHNPRTCRKLSMGQPIVLELVARKTGIPFLEFEADHSDPDFYSPAQIDTRIMAFLEMLGARKARGRV